MSPDDTHCACPCGCSRAAVALALCFICDELERRGALVHDGYHQTPKEMTPAVTSAESTRVEVPF